MSHCFHVKTFKDFPQKKKKMTVEISSSMHVIFFILVHAKLHLHTWMHLMPEKGDWQADSLLNVIGQMCRCHTMWPFVGKAVILQSVFDIDLCRIASLSKKSDWSCSSVLACINKMKQHWPCIKVEIKWCTVLWFLSDGSHLFSQ